MWHLRPRARSHRKCLRIPACPTYNPRIIACIIISTRTRSQSWMTRGMKLVRSRMRMCLMTIKSRVGFQISTLWTQSSGATSSEISWRITEGKKPSNRSFSTLNNNDKNRPTQSRDLRSGSEKTRLRPLNATRGNNGPAQSNRSTRARRPPNSSI